MDDLLKLGFILATSGYLLLYAGVWLQLFGDAAKILSAIAVFGSLNGTFILLYFGVNKLFPNIQNYSSIVQGILLFLLLGVSCCLFLLFMKYLKKLDRECNSNSATE